MMGLHGIVDMTGGCLFLGRAEELGEVPKAFPFLFWRVSVAALSSRHSGDGWVSCCGRWVMPRLGDDP
jgi:hypothetical protein